MSIELGSGGINKIYLGNTEIKKVYLGSDLIYDKTAAGGFLLDLYPNAAAAYSLRQLRTGVTNVVRVRRSSDNIEQDFTPTQITDGTLTTFTGAGDGFVSAWYDQSGNGADMIQPNAIRQPYIVQSGVLVLINGLPAVFSSINAAFMYGATTFPTGDVLTTNFSVIKALDFLNDIANCLTGVQMGVLAGSDRKTIQNVLESPTVASVRLQGGNTVFATSSADSQVLYTTYRDAVNTDFKGRMNGTALSVSSSGAAKNLNIQSDSAFTIFQGGGSQYTATPIPNGRGRGYVQESLWWLSDNSANLSGIETNINNHYSIY